MSTLVSEQLKELGLSQEIILDRDILVAAFRPCIYVHNNPAGTFYFNVYSGVTLIKSYEFTSLQAQEAFDVGNNYYWGYLSLKGLLLLDRGSYTIKLESTGYTYDPSAWLGWCKDWQKRPENTLGPTSDFSVYPYAFTIIEYSEREY